MIFEGRFHCVSRTTTLEPTRLVGVASRAGGRGLSGALHARRSHRPALTNPQTSLDMIVATTTTPTASHRHPSPPARTRRRRQAFARYFPALIQPASYDSGASRAAKENNWAQVRRAPSSSFRVAPPPLHAGHVFFICSCARATWNPARRQPASIPSQTSVAASFARPPPAAPKVRQASRRPLRVPRGRPRRAHEPRVGRGRRERRRRARAARRVRRERSLPATVLLCCCCCCVSIARPACRDVASPPA